MRSIKITICGKTFRIRSDAEEDYLCDLAREVDERFQAIKRSGARQDQEFKAMSMVAIGLLDELKMAKEGYTSLRTKARQFATQMIAKIDELLSVGSR